MTHIFACAFATPARRAAAADMVRALRAVPTPSLTPRERNRAIRSHARGYAIRNF
jgi:hypothetical protein